MDAVLNDMMMPELGGLRMTSPPTPASRLPLSFMIPVVMPTMMRISVTSSATARILTNVRTGLEVRLAMMMCLFNDSFLSVDGFRAADPDYLTARALNRPADPVETCLPAA